MAETAGADPAVAGFYRLLLQRGDAGLAQVWFGLGVLDRYREAGYELIRTNTIGRVKKPGGWALDFGIVDEAGIIHASIGDVLQQVPEGERGHWCEHIASPPASANFLSVRLHPGSCFDDGDARSF